MFVHTCTMMAMSMGSMVRGKRRMLKSAMEVNAFSASSTFSELTATNTPNVAKETYSKRTHNVSECFTVHSCYFTLILLSFTITFYLHLYLDILSVYLYFAIVGN